MTEENDIEFLDRLGEQLAAARIPPRRRAPIVLSRLAAAAAVLVVAVVGMLAIRPETASAGVEVLHRGGRVEIRLTERESDATAVERAIRDVGFDVSVLDYPVGPSLVGRFIGVSTSGDAPDELVQLEDRRGFSLPEGWPGHVDLQLGRPARAGDIYLRPSNAFAPEEPLACTDLLGKSAVLAADVVSGLDVEVEWLIADSAKPGVPRPVDEKEIRRSPNSALLVSLASSYAPDTAVIFLTPDGRPPTGPSEQDQEEVPAC